jgi:leader peptidase (prepilin peptidase) / N-methyltransferase
MMPSAIALAAMTVSALLCAWGARRDLQLPAALTTGIFVAVCAGVSGIFGGEFAPLAVLAIVCLFIVETDRRHHLIPDLFVLALLALSFAQPFADDPTTRLIGAIALGLTFLVVRYVCTMWRGVEALGWGDVKLAFAMGAVLGPVYGFAAIAIAGAATLTLVALHARDGAATLGAPFGVGLASATAATAIVRAMMP